MTTDVFGGNLMRDIERSLSALGARIQPEPSTPQQIDALLERILLEPQQSRGPARRRKKRGGRKARNLSLVGLLAAGAAAAVFGSGLLDQPFPEPANPATPPMLRVSAEDNMSAPQALEAIARRTEKLKETAPSDGHFVQDTWSLTTRIGGHQITSAVVPERRDSWKRSDGSIDWKVKAEKPQFQNSGQKKLWEQQWSALDEPTTRSGKGGSSYGNPPAPEKMAQWLKEGSPGDTAGFISESLVQKMMTNHLDPEQRAEMLRTLAARKDLKLSGTTKDRAGREGLAFTVESDSSGLPSKHMLVIDADNGRILAYDEILTEDPGALNVKIPAVINYVTFLQG
ncbi:hypothetical protein [Streptomyces sp. R35]|uniref:CU044_5270 family protein n=1 Tax=Streptomyces sp. R35 TaxID=3238630 RepID=A0AB39SJK4_9ACTN